MTTKIFNKHLVQVAEGRNLAILNTYARRMHGVKKIVVDPLIGNGSNTNGAELTVYFKRGFISTVRFASFTIAEKWATNKSSREGTYWTGAIIVIRDELKE